jgi:uncharacterized protein YjbI with pentapeptide repeats
MSQLLTDKDQPLHIAKPGDNLSTVAQARTLTVLTRLDGERKGSLVRFLYEARLIDKEQALIDESELIERRHTIITLHQADLSGADLSEADLREANLRAAKSWTEEQLRAAKSLESATMPNGQKYEDWLKSKGSREDGENAGAS